MKLWVNLNTLSLMATELIYAQQYSEIKLHFNSLQNKLQEFKRHIYIYIVHIYIYTRVLCLEKKVIFKKNT